jgi:O-antigen/teichoic acid export membrane protein
MTQTLDENREDIATSSPPLRKSEIIMVVLAKIALFGAQYGILRIYTEYTTPTEYGKFSLLLVSVALGATLLYGPLGNMCSLEYHKGASRERGSAFGAALVLGSLPLLALVCTPFVSEKFRAYWGMAVILLTFTGLTNILSNLLNTARRRIAFLFSSNAEIVIRIIVVFVAGQALLTLSGEILGIISVGSAFSAFIVTAWLWRGRLRVYWKGWDGKTLTMAVPFILLALCGWALAISDRWFLTLFRGVAETGRYAAFYQACSVISAVSTGFAATIAQPLIFQKTARAESTGQVMTSAVRAALILTAPTLIALAWIPDFFLQLVISHKYGLPSPWLVVGVGVGAFLLGLESVVSMGVVARTSTWRVVRYASIGAFTNIALNLIFIPRFGAIAAGLSTGLAYGIEATLVLFAAKKTCGLRLPLPSIIAATMLAIVGAAFVQFSTYSLPTRAILAAVGILCWTALSRDILIATYSELKNLVQSRATLLT